MKENEIAWDLSKIFSNYDDPRISKTIDKLQKQANEFVGKYKGKISETELEKLMKDAIGVKIPPKLIGKKPPSVKKEEIDKEIPRKVEITWEEAREKEGIPPKKIEPSQKVLTEKTLRNWTINELREYCRENDIEVPSKVRKEDIIKIVQEFYKNCIQVYT